VQAGLGTWSAWTELQLGCLENFLIRAVDNRRMRASVAKPRPLAEISSSTSSLQLLNLSAT